ncbi:hypothetical protein ACOACO_10075 [Nocardioides sp. CPCC 205120]|uniref:hypothetical protein n=1 Tax=Nocardioides sp. CPCC 205120 TaxID=3406462 RepID=UPI003B501860
MGGRACRDSSGERDAPPFPFTVTWHGEAPEQYESADELASDLDLYSDGPCDAAEDQPDVRDAVGRRVRVATDASLDLLLAVRVPDDYDANGLYVIEAATAGGTVWVEQYAGTAHRCYWPADRRAEPAHWSRAAVVPAGADARGPVDFRVFADAWHQARRAPQP